MSTTLTIVLMAVVTYIPRLLGFVLSERSVSAFWLRFLYFVPIAVFAALIVPAIPGTNSEAPLRFVASGLTVLVIWRVNHLALGILVGMGSFWLLKVFF